MTLKIVNILVIEISMESDYESGKQLSWLHLIPEIGIHGDDIDNIIKLCRKV